MKDVGIIKQGSSKRDLELLTLKLLGDFIAAQEQIAKGLLPKKNPMNVYLLLVYTYKAYRRKR